MYGIDQFLLAGTFSTLFWLFASVYLQKKFHIYTLFMGKKHAYVTHLVVMSFVGLQQIALTAFDIYSGWLFTTVLWPLGGLLFAASLMLIASVLDESKPGFIVGAEFFGKPKPHKGKVWQRYRYPFAVGVSGTYLGLALLTGHIAFLFVSVILLVGLPIVDWARHKL